MTDEKQEEIKLYFNYQDKQQTGVIQWADVLKILQWLGFNPTITEMDSYKEEYDKASEGKVNLHTMLRIVDKRIVQPDTIEELIEAMKILDEHGTGTIDSNYLRYCLHKVGRDLLEHKEINDLLKALDCDSDNKTNVDIMEFAMKSFNIKAPRAG